MTVSLANKMTDRSDTNVISLVENINSTYWIFKSIIQDVLHGLPCKEISIDKMKFAVHFNEATVLVAEQFIEAIFNELILEKVKKITTLVFKNCLFTELTWKKLLNGLDNKRSREKTASITAIEFFSCHIKSEHLEILLENLFKFNSIFSLKINSQIFKQLQFFTIEQYGSKLSTSHIEQLTLSRVGMNDINLNILLEAIKTNSVLKGLYLKNNKITDSGTYEIATILRHDGLPNLCGLSLANNQIGDRGALALAEMLEYRPFTPFHLSLEGNKEVTDIGGLALISQTSIVRLNLINTNLCTLEVLFKAIARADMKSLSINRTSFLNRLPTQQFKNRMEQSVHPQCQLKIIIKFQDKVVVDFSDPGRSCFLLSTLL